MHTPRMLRYPASSAGDSPLRGQSPKTEPRERVEEEPMHYMVVEKYRHGPVPSGL